MTPKEKAIELVERYSMKVSVYFTEDSIPRIVNADLRKESAKEFALIAVDKIIDFEKLMIQRFNLGYYSSYWIEVKQEIEKL